LAYQLAVLKYRAVVNPSQVFELDTTGPISPNPQIVFFLNDYLNPIGISPENKITTSELKFKINDSEEVQINKDYTSNTVQVLLNGVASSQDFFELLSEKLKSPIDTTSWSKLVIDFVKNNINTVEDLQKFLPISSQSAGNTDDLITKASEGLTKEESDKLVRLRETNLKIKAMDAEVGSYQNQKKNKEEVKKNKEKVDRDVKELEDKLSSVNMLIESQKRLKGELEKFSNITSDSTIPQKVDNIKENRSKSLSSSLKTIRKSAGVHMESEEKEGSLLVGKWMVGLVIAQLVFSLLFFIITFQLIQLLIGVFSAVVILILMLLVNVNRYSYEYKGRFQTETPTLPISVHKSNPDEDKLILNNAWSKALVSELKMIDETMKSRLGDKTLEQISLEKQNLLEEQKKLDAQVSETEGKSLNTEEYYKKRRELDILKIEKENIEFSLEGKIKQDIEDQIAASGDTNIKSEASLPLLFVNCKIEEQIADYINNIKQTRQVLILNY